MKILLTVLLTAFSCHIFAQCRDIYGNKCECPTEQDSLTIYNNALKVMLFYDDNKHYRLSKSTELVGMGEKRETYDRLVDARRYFNVIRRALKNDVKHNSKYKDITYDQYYQEIDEYRFYQRELENQTVNANSEFPMYDIRIHPILINEYINEDTSDAYYGDLVQIPLYVPVVVKPYDLLTGPELALRNKLLHIVAKDSNLVIKPVIREMIKRDSEAIKLIPEIKILPKYEGTPIYCYNAYGSACIIGFIQNRVFVRIKPEHYADYAVMKYAQDLLNDVAKLNQYLHQKFGSYIVQIL